MKSLVFAFVLVVACVLGLGFYMGWFHFSSGNDGNSANITLSVDKGKIQDDKDKAVNTVQDTGQDAKDTTTATTPKAQE